MALDPAQTHFFDLPGEIRNTIYKYCFGNLAFHYCSPDFIKDARRFTNTRWSTTLFSVNHQVRQEALSAFSDNLTVYCDYINLTSIPLACPEFILANLTKLVVCENSSLSVPGLKHDIKTWRTAMPKLETLSILHTYPLPIYHTWGLQEHRQLLQVITSFDELISMLRGNIGEDALVQDGYLQEDYLQSGSFDGMAEDNFRLIWKIEPANEIRHLDLRHLYRIEFAPATLKIHTRRINVSQSRSYLFGTWVPAEDVTLLIDEVSFPAVWCVKHNMGRVLTSRCDLIQRVEEELQDPQRLARALDKGFSCGGPMNGKQKRSVSAKA